jgi:hypothetical protein
MPVSSEAVVRRALDILKPHLSGYVRDTLANYALPGPSREDTHGLTSSILQNWNTAFAPRLPHTIRNYVFELRDVRNRLAHEEPFSTDAVRRAIDTARLIAGAIDAPRSLIDQLERLAEAQQPVGSDRVITVHEMSRRDRPNPTPRPLVDRGVIVNAVELSANDLAMKRVLCPACAEKVFEQWSAGWDAHAAHRCKGLAALSYEDRKREYKSRFGHLFRR